MRRGFGLIVVKRLIAIAFTLFTAAAIPAESTLWVTAVSKQEGMGRAIVFRYVQAFPPEFQRTRFPIRVILVWQYKSESGMPVTHEREAMDRMEDLLEPLIKNATAGVLAIVSTGENLREWIFYTRSEQEFLLALNKALEGHPPFPIDIHVASDPQWSTYEHFRKIVRE